MSARWNCMEDEDVPNVEVPECVGEKCNDKGIKNCKQWKKCGVCPCKYVKYSFDHCRLCWKPACQSWTEDDDTARKNLAQQDMLCGKYNTGGAICCPFTTLCCLLSPIAICFLGTGSLACCITGSVLQTECCQDIKVEPCTGTTVNRAPPSSSAPADNDVVHSSDEVPPSRLTRR